MTQSILVCGASGGLGSVVASYLQAQGCHVFGTMREPPAVAQHPFPMIPLDVTCDESASACVQQVVEQAGSLDVIINCCNDMTLGSVQDTSMAEMATMFDINVLGAMRMCKAALAPMRAQGHGTIINMSSLGGVLAVPSTLR